MTLKLMDERTDYLKDVYRDGEKIATVRRLSSSDYNYIRNNSKMETQLDEDGSPIVDENGQIEEKYNMFKFNIFRIICALGGEGRKRSSEGWESDRKITYKNIDHYLHPDDMTAINKAINEHEASEEAIKGN